MSQNRVYQWNLNSIYTMQYAMQYILVLTKVTFIANRAKRVLKLIVTFFVQILICWETFDEEINLLWIYYRMDRYPLWHFLFLGHVDI